MHKDDIIPSVKLGSHVRSDHDLSMIGNLMCSDEAKHGASSSSSSSFASSSCTEFQLNTVSTQKYGNSVAVYEWESNRTPPQPSGGVKGRVNVTVTESAWAQEEEWECDCGRPFSITLYLSFLFFLLKNITFNLINEDPLLQKCAFLMLMSSIMLDLDHTYTQWKVFHYWVIFTF